MNHVVPHVTSRTPSGERTMDLVSRLLDDRIVYLATPIDSSVASMLVAQLLHLESDDATSPINLYISSPGGAIAPTLGVYDAMQFVTPPVHTTCIGEAGPNAALLLGAGAPGARSMLPHARVVLHQPSREGHQGAVPDLIVAAEEVERVRAQLESILARHTGRTPAQVRDDTDRSLVLDGEAAIAYGLVDRVIADRGTDRAVQAARHTG